MRKLITAAAVTGILSVTACGSSTPAAAPAAVPSHAATHRAAPSASPSCKRTTTFDYIVRDSDPGASVMADEIGNTDYVDCKSSLADFAATAGQAPGECTTIALASDNPGYKVNQVPARPLKDVIESAGPGC
jgi:hypothetical protein